MACYLTTLGHWLNQCDIFNKSVHWHSPENIFTAASAQAIILYNAFENCTFKISVTSPSAQCVQMSLFSSHESIETLKIITLKKKTIHT